MGGQDITPPERVRADPKCDREVTVYGYARGCNLKPGARVHLAGVGDYPVRPCFLAPAPQAGPRHLSLRDQHVSVHSDRDRVRKQEEQVRPSQVASLTRTRPATCTHPVACP